VANPNIVNVTTILGNTSTTLISSTANPFATALVNNAASSGKVYKINSIVAANVDGSSACDITISILSQIKRQRSISWKTGLLVLRPAQRMTSLLRSRGKKYQADRGIPCLYADLMAL
jgi:uncharacterized protein YjhX (UPF0386 family)